MRTIQIDIYSFNELTKEVKDRVLNNWRYTYVDNHNWWDGVNDDANIIGLDIKEFDIENNYISFGDVCLSTVRELILKEHGTQAETYKAAINFKNPSLLTALKKYYLDLLNDEYTYLISDKSIIECFENSGYEFYKDGSLYS